MNLLFSMSLAGSLVFLLYFMVKPIARYHLPASWRYGLLKASLLFYLLPYQHFKFRYIGAWRTLFSDQQPTAPADLLVATNIDRVLMIDAEGHLHFKNQTLFFIILAIWSILALVFLLYQLIKYLHCMKNLELLKRTPLDTPDGSQTNGFRTEVSLFASQYISTPFTIGIFSPRIILPTSLAGRKERPMIIAHEMAHIKNHDNLIKFLWMLAMILHWYNPLIYLLYWEICQVSEQVCDAAVTNGMSAQEKEQYKLLIIELGQETSKTDTLLASPFSQNYKALKERIMIMDKTTLFSKKKQIAVTLVMVAAIAALSPLSVLAYSPMPTWEFESEMPPMEGEYYTLPLGQCPEICEYDPFQEYGTEHDLFIADDGQVYIIDDAADPQVSRLNCRHSWKDGTTYSHVKSDNGGCTIYYYDCQYCTICSSKKDLVYKSSINYAVCPH